MTENKDSLPLFLEQLRSFDKQLHLAVRFSDATNGMVVKDRFAYASFLLSRLCVVGMTLGTLIRAAKRDDGRVITLDHTSILALSRNIVEAGLMFSYLSERDVDDDTWKLRRDVLFLHDATSRYKMFKAFGQKEEAKIHRKRREELSGKIKSSPGSLALSADEQGRIIGGSQFYIGGLRGAARTAGWNVSHFDGVYVYFSQHTHSGPLSFIRTVHH